MNRCKQRSPYSCARAHTGVAAHAIKVIKAKDREYIGQGALAGSVCLTDFVPAAVCGCGNGKIFMCKCYDM